jgi:dolichol-phosphate mannosyltransferase
VTSVALSAAAVEMIETEKVAHVRLVPATAPNVFLVPAYNEEQNLPRLFEDFERRPELFPPGSRMVVVDDGSQDDTAGVVERYDGSLPVELLRLDRNQGPGAAFRAGFDKALETCCEESLVVTLEADTTSDLDALPEMLERARNGAEVVLASWVMLNVSAPRRTLSRAAGFVVRLCLGVDAKTVSSFFRVYRASTLRAARTRYGADLIREPGFACKAEILAKLASMGAKIEEVPVGLDSSKRIGESKMPVMRTMLAYFRMLARQVFTRETETQSA